MAGGAGLVSASVFLIAFSGSIAGIMLTYLSPLPVFAAALALGGAAGVVAAVLGTVPVIVGAGLPFGLAFAIFVAAPAAALGRLAMLSRTDEQGAVEWYPPGALTGWLCVIGLAALAVFCGFLARHSDGLSGGVNQLTTELAGLLQIEEKDDFVVFFQRILPGFSVASWMLLLVVNAVLAQGLLRAVNQAGRPSPDIAALTLPRWIAPAAALAALAAVLLRGNYAYFAGSMLFVMAVPYFLQGLAVVHLLARKIGADSMILAVFYVTLVVIGSGVIPLIVLLGLVEQIIGLRRRMDGGDRA
jgi:hypothetical protein